MNPVLIYLMRIEGISVNIEAAPNEKQWAKILEWTEELKASQTAPASQPVVSQGTTTVVMPPAGYNGTSAPTDLMAQVAELKRSGQAKAAAGAGPVALDAGPPAGARKK